MFSYMHTYIAMYMSEIKKTNDLPEHAGTQMSYHCPLGLALPTPNRCVLIRNYYIWYLGLYNRNGILPY